MASELLDSLLRALNENEVRYCHWKSNVAISKAFSGESDLDILVARKSLSQALAILLELGFKPGTAKWGPGIPTVSHYYGYDPGTEHFVHIHLFSSVLTGESFAKSHVLPFDVMLLENMERIDQINVPSKPPELLVFVVRMFIKFGSLPDLIYLRGQSRDIEEELAWLAPDTNLAEATLLLRKYCPVLTEELFVECINSLRDKASLPKRILLAWRVRRKLAVYRKYTRVQRATAYVRLLWGRLQRRFQGRQKNKMLCAGGAVVAFTGPEATGKSTLVSGSAHWLGTVFAVKTVHGGKPPSSWLTLPLSAFVTPMRRLWPSMRTTRFDGATSSSDQSPDEDKRSYSLIHAIRLAALAWDRRALLVKARRSAVNGEIVICDRYPSEEWGVMDSRRLQENAAGRGPVALIYNWLARLEERVYAEIPPPDVVLRLKVSIETAKQRNRERLKPGKETDAYLEYRHRQMKNWRRSGTKCVYDIDTEGSLEETVSRAKRAIWESL